MRALTLFLLLFMSLSGLSQRTVVRYQPQKGSVRIGPGSGDMIPYGDKGFTLLLPDSTMPVRGVIVVLEDGKFVVDMPANQVVHPAALPRGLAVLHLTTGVPIDLYFKESSLRYVDSALQAVLKEFALNRSPLYFLGVNLDAHRTLRYLEWKDKQKGEPLPVKAVALCEGVLDWVRQWNESDKAIRDNFAESSVGEARMLTYLLGQQLGGTPKNRLSRYLSLSTYSYFDEARRPYRYLRNMPVRAYTEPATLYWMEAKRKATFDTNFPDQVGIITELKLLGNKQAELVLFQQPPSNMDQRNPNYTWGLVNKTELVDWILKQQP